MQLRRLRFAVVLCSSLMIVAIATGTILSLDRLRSTTEANAQDLVRRLSREAEGVINRQFLAVDGVLAGLPALIGQISTQGSLDPALANRTLRNLNFQNLNFRDLVILRADGSPWASALAASRTRAPPIDPARLDAARTGGTLVVSGPARNPMNGEWALFFVRAAALPEVGQVLMVAEVPVALLATLLAPFSEVAGLRLSIERADAQVLASLPHDETRIGTTLARSALALPQDGMAREVPGRFADTPVIATARPLLYRSILVVASLEVRAAMAGYHQDRRRLLVVAAISAGLFGALGIALYAALWQRERTEAERAAARGLLGSAIETMSDGFVMFDAEDRLVACNQRYRDLYAVSAPFIVPGARFDHIIREGAKRGQYPQAGDDIEAFVAATAAWHRGDHPSMERLLPDGRWILVTERRTPNGGTVGIRTDISDLKRAMADLAQARDVAAAATEAKSRFLARMSHELRTPLNGVLGLAQVLARDPALGAEQRVRAQTLEAAGRHLVAVANDVLDLAKVEAGQLELRLAPIELTGLLRGCATLVRPAAEEKGVAIGFDFAVDLPITVEIDQTRTRQLLLNLLSNAVRFTPPGGRIELTARPTGALDPDGMVPIRIEVRDTGPGVPADQRDAIFGDFVQLDKGGAGGTGLGLAIAAGIVEQMGGTIGCEANAGSATGQGAIFWVALRMRPVGAVRKDVAPPGVAPRRGLHVLVADDVAANLAVARALLESAGHTVHCVSDGALAVHALTEATGTGGLGRPFDVVLMDVMMPGTDGLEATRRIRALPGPAGRVPILAVTASAFAEDIAACRAAGMDAHLAKPIERDALMAALTQLTRDAPAAAETTPAAPGFDTLPLLTRPGNAPLLVSGLDPTAAQHLVGEFVREMREAASQLRAAEPSATELMVPAAHRLAGAAATLGATRLATAARHFQSEARRLQAEAVLGQRRILLDIAAATLAALEPSTGPTAGPVRDDDPAAIVLV